MHAAYSALEFRVYAISRPDAYEFGCPAHPQNA